VLARTLVVIEDEPDIRNVLEAGFRAAGFRVYAYETGEAGVEGVRIHRPDVVTLDLGLPDIDGYEVARRIRLFSNAYVLMLTARAQEVDVLLGLESGADDYVSKPFRFREIRYRVEALLRRPRLRSDAAGLTDSSLSELAADAAPPASPTLASGRLLTHNGLSLRVDARTVAVDGVDVKLTRSEFDLLLSLLVAGRTVSTKEDLARTVRGGPDAPDGFGRDLDEQVIHVHIANLRKKLGDSVLSPRWVETVHGFGYRLAPLAVTHAAAREFA
jgi:two-component system, OmpR family, response regulator